MRRIALERAFRHHVHGAADGARAMDDRSRAMQHLDAFGQPAVQRLGELAAAREEARAIIDLHDRRVALEPAQRIGGAV